MTAFKDKEWSQRYKKLGDEAEAHFEEYCRTVLKRGFVRFGLNRPDEIQIHSMPGFIRYKPDYLMTRYLVEVQGLGQDQLVKIKVDKWVALHQWDTIRDTHFSGVQMYLWDSHKQREVMFPLMVFDVLLGNGRGSLGSFPEKKAYIQFAADEVFIYAANL